MTLIYYFRYFSHCFSDFFRSKSYSKYNPTRVYFRAKMEEEKFVIYCFGMKISPKSYADSLLQTDIKIARLINEPYYTIDQPHLRELSSLYGCG